jgi:RNA processing factor Prp31
MITDLIERMDDIDEAIDIINMKINELKSIQINNTYVIMKLKDENNQIKRTIKCLCTVILINCVGIASCLGYIYS